MPSPRRSRRQPRCPVSLILGLAVLLPAAALVAAGCSDDDPSATDAQPPPRVGNPFAYDADLPLRLETYPLPTPFEIAAVNVSFESFDGERVPATLISEGGRRPCVMFVAGLGNSLQQATATSLTFAGQGYTALTVEPRYHGSWTAGISPDQAARDPRLLFDMVRGSVIDLRRALDYLAGSGRCEGDEVAYVGISFGGILGALLAGVDDRIDAAVLVVAGGDWRALVAESDDQQLLPVGIDENDPEGFERALELLAPVDPARWIGRSSSPLLMINGTDDQVVPDASAEALHQAAQEPKQVFWYEGTHNAFLGPQAEQVGEEMAMFLDAWRSGL